ncbi:hypothetical protein [Novosphingobium sp. ST904]|uniref:hypothetical protein n=1 Tax=Novosphingobium sp. ST904 TaxID=1684385 RepID=UPI0006C86ED3|nr:hypothetical protein [Novosphingobium sp. ST904]KPH66901.1 hypothetical protein ADT71_03885 [Novosphingobium sp. ST904]TCM39149.1 hypothetical protein EDF59_10628 [Novosphingobium sp. ST904]
MANLLKGEVPLILSDKREFTLVFDMDALIEAEGVYRKPMHVMAADASAGFMGATRAMLFGALQAHHPGVSLKDVSEMLKGDTLAITEALTKALDQSMPPPAKASAGGKAAVAPRPGRTSGANGAKRSSTRTASGG